MNANNEVMNIYEGQNATPAKKAVTEMAISRQAQEVQAAMVVAKRFPRSENESYDRIMEACKRPSLAEQAMYEYPRGGTKVTGPSIRLAETLARCWGNIDFGIVELEQRYGESQVMAYAWDLETNTRQTKIFSVPHTRYTKKGSQNLDDPRDVYELVANNGARRLRACILGVIPGDVIDSAIEQCNATLKKADGRPLADKIRQMTQAFKDNFSVTIPMLEKFIGCKSEAFSENDLLRLRKVFVSLRDGMAKREDFFELPKPGEESAKEAIPAAPEPAPAQEVKQISLADL